MIPVKSRWVMWAVGLSWKTAREDGSVESGNLPNLWGTLQERQLQLAGVRCLEVVKRRKTLVLIMLFFYIAWGVIACSFPVGNGRSNPVSSEGQITSGQHTDKSPRWCEQLSVEEIMALKTRGRMEAFSPVLYSCSVKCCCFCPLLLATCIWGWLW